MHTDTITRPTNGSSAVAAATPEKELLTTSSIDQSNRCGFSYFLKYVCGFVPERQEDHFRIGEAFHLGQELYADSEIENDEERQVDAIHLATASYDRIPDNFDPDDWKVERETVANLLAGHFWRYGRDNLKAVAWEREFRIPLINPVTHRASRTWEFAGKIDKIVELPDGRLAVLEYKTTKSDIGPDSKYWLRLRQDGQISRYVIAARVLGFNVETVIYDVTRKPSIRPHQIPLLDEKGIKIVLDAEGKRCVKENIKKNGEPGVGHGEPYQSGNAEKGWVLQTRTETAEEFGARLLQDITDRPDFYYARREIPRLESDLERAKLELWIDGKRIAECKRMGWFTRHVKQFTCDACEYRDHCLNGAATDPDTPPPGFKKVDWTHPELTNPAEA